MKSDEQIIKRPDCQGCGWKEGGFVYYGPLILCGHCVEKIKKKEAERQKAWLQES